jgi:hypothetical protein
MFPQLLRGFAVILVLRKYAAALPRTHQLLHNHTQLRTSFYARDESDSGWPEPVSITRMAAIGDSYSAGIGARDRLDKGDGMSHYHVPRFSSLD